MLCVTNTTVSPRCAPQRREVVVEPLARELVERAERLVHQQQVGLGDERAGDRRAHLHAAGQLARKMARERRRARPAPAPPRPSRRPRARRAGEVERQAHVGVDARPRHQRRRLEHEADAGGRVAAGRVAAAAPPRKRARRSARASPAMRRSSVVLPQPDGPSSVRNSPARDVEVDRLRARACRWRTSWRRRRPRRPARRFGQPRRQRAGYGGIADVFDDVDDARVTPSRSRRRPWRGRRSRRKSTVACQRASVIVSRPRVCGVAAGDDRVLAASCARHRRAARRSSAGCPA